MKAQAPLAQTRTEQANLPLTREEKQDIKLLAAFAKLSERELLRLFVGEMRQLAAMIHTGDVEEVRRRLASKGHAPNTSMAA